MVVVKSDISFLWDTITIRRKKFSCFLGWLLRSKGLNWAKYFQGLYNSILSVPENISWSLVTLYVESMWAKSECAYWQFMCLISELEQSCLNTRSKLYTSLQWVSFAIHSILIGISYKISSIYKLKKVIRNIIFPDWALTEILIKSYLYWMSPHRHHNVIIAGNEFRK